MNDIKFIESIDISDLGFEILTDTGYKPLTHSHKTIEYEIYNIRTSDYELGCADKHRVFTEGYSDVYVEDLSIGDLIYTERGLQPVENIELTGIHENMYDLTVDDENHRYYTNGILSHNSTVTRAYAIWYLLFHPEKVVCILGNKLALAMEQLQQLKDSFLRLPMWMQPGVTSWSKKSFNLCNNSRILCAATSPDGIRGLSINLLILDEFAFIPAHTANDFMASVFPTISSGNTTKVIIISTPFGMNHFYEMWNKAGDTIDESANEYIRTFVDWRRAGRSEEWAAKERVTLGDIRFNQEYACKFLGSASTLIDSNKLEQLVSIPPLKIPNLPSIVSIYDLPIPKRELDRHGWEYAASIDTSYGTKADYSVMQICLVKDNISLMQVATIRCNYMNVNSFAAICKQVLHHYYNPPLVIESNGPGIQMVSTFHENYEYDNLIHFDKKELGLMASDKKKSSAVILLKTYIERDFLTINDQDTLKELYTFGQRGNNKWGSGAGSHDDCITSLYWILYYINSPYYFGNEVDLDNVKNDEEMNFMKKLKLGASTEEEYEYGSYDEDGNSIMDENDSEYNEE